MSQVFLTVGMVLLVAYLLGSISFAVWCSRWFGLADPRSYGSGNPGATNVLRSGSKKAAVATLVGDALKGAVAVLLAKWAMAHFGLPTVTPALAGLAAFVGHVFPVFHGFKGGKGVATAAGVLLALNLWLGGATALTWLIIFGFFRTSSLAALSAAVFAFFYQVFLFGINPEAFVVWCMCMLLIVRHKENIVRLLRGEESRVGAAKRSSADQP